MSIYESMGDDGSSSAGGGGFSDGLPGGPPKPSVTRMYLDQIAAGFESVDAFKKNRLAQLTTGLVLFVVVLVLYMTLSGGDDGGQAQTASSPSTSTPSTGFCTFRSGNSEPADWQQDSSSQQGDIFVDIDTGTHGDQHFVTSMGYTQAASHAVTGASAVYRPLMSAQATNTIRVYLRIQPEYSGGVMTGGGVSNTLTPQDAMSSMYYITWMTEAAPCSGAGSSDDANGVTTWHAYNGLLYTDVQFAQGAHAFSTTPVIVSSLHGTTGHANVRGGSNIYQASPTGFRVFLHSATVDVPGGSTSTCGGTGCTADQAQQNGWKIEYLATEDRRSSGNYETDWDNNGPEVHASISTAEAQFAHDSIVDYVTSLSGDDQSDMFSVDGVTSLMAASWSGFQVFLFSDTASTGGAPLVNGNTNLADSGHWRVNWIGVERAAATSAACSAPPAVQHGTWLLPSGTGFSVGASASLTCDSGYTVSQNFNHGSLTCTGMQGTDPQGPYASSGWTGNLVVCVNSATAGSTCIPPAVLHGTWSPSGQVTVGSTTTLACDPGFTLDGQGAVFGYQPTLTCGSGGTFDRQAPSCVGSTTPTGPTCRLPGDYNGAWSASSTGTPMFPQGATTTLHCQTGFQPTTLLGEATTLTCGPNGQWNHPASQCVAPGGGGTTTPTGPTCRLPGDYNGAWSASPTGTPMFPQGATTTLTCNPGFQLSASPLLGEAAMLTCLSTGQWNHPAAQCVAPGGGGTTTPTGLTCPSISDPFGTWSAPQSGGSYTAGTTTTLTCRSGYTSLSTFGEQSTLTCGSNGVWTANGVPALQATCISNTPPSPPQTASVCAPPLGGVGGSWTPTPANGFQANSIATLTCAAGYQVEGATLFHQPTLTCYCPPNGGPCDWNQQQERCVSIAPPPPPPVGTITCQTPNTPNGVWSPDGRGAPSPPGGYAPGATATLVCQSGYTVLAMFGESSVLTCGPAGQWNRPADQCLTTPASSTCTLPTTQNGQWSDAPAGGFVIGSTTTLTCNPGYIAQSIFGQEQTLTCGTNTAGQWAGAPDVCLQPASIGPSPPATGGLCTLPTTPYGTWSLAGPGGFTAGSTTALTCIPGYQATGSFGAAQTLACSTNGQWSGVPAQCQLIGGGTTTPTGPTCTLPGEYSGAWSASPTGTFTAGSTTSLSCNTGYQPSTVFGEATTLTCTSTGVWIPRAAQCLLPGQPPPPTPPSPTPPCTLPGEYNGAWSPSPTGTFTAGSITSLSCNPGYQPSTVFGQATTLACTSTGQWSSRAAQCLLPGQPPPPTPPSPTPPCTLPGEYNGAWSPSPTGTFTAGTSTSLSCSPGYLPSTVFGQATTLTCTSTGQWDSQAAPCQQGTSTGGGGQTTSTTCAAPASTAGDTWSQPGPQGFTQNTQIVLTCQAGYVLESLFGQQSTLTCICPLNGGPCDWNAPQDRCLSSGTPPPPPVGTITCQTPNTFNGVWSPDGSGAPSPPGGYAPGATARLVCQSGYSVSAIFGSQAVLTCGANGQWTHAPDDCLPTQTSSTCTPPTTANGQWSAAPAGGFVIGSTTTLTCNPGYNPQSIFGQEQTLTCGTITAGQWDGSADVCLQSSSTGPSPPATGVCPLPTTTNGDWSAPPSGASFATGQTTVLTCHPGYAYGSTSGTQRVGLTCTATGWDHSYATCDFSAQGGVCAPLSDPNGLWVDAYGLAATPPPPGGFNVGDTVTLTCPTNYHASGTVTSSDNLLCDSTGWSHQPDTCVSGNPTGVPQASCGALFDANGQWTLSDSVGGDGSTATLTCNAGFAPQTLFNQGVQKICNNGVWGPQASIQCAPAGG